MRLRYYFIIRKKLLQCTFLQACMIIGKEVHTVSDAKKAASALLTKGCKSVILTLGSQGAVYASSAAQQEPIHVPAPKVQALDTTVRISAVCFADKLQLSF